MPPKGPPLHPLRFKEIFKKKVWGGPELRKAMGKTKATGNTGESWEISHRTGALSVLANGPHKGWSIEKLLAEFGREILGVEQSMRFRRFPLLVKMIAAHERLSLQVHPSDEYAQRYEPEGVGKMEAWYVLAAPPGGRVIRGVLPGTTVAEFKEHLQAGTIEKCLNVMEVKERDVIFLPPGTIHSAYGGVVLLEVQQNSDVTYRLYDWDRKGLDKRPRTLHVEKAMNVTDFYSMGVSKYKPSRILGYGYRRRLLIKCEKFTMESIEMKRQRISEKAHPERFVVHTIVSGKGNYLFGDRKTSKQAFKKGETYLIPAGLGDYDIVAQTASEIVVSYVE